MSNITLAIKEHQELIQSLEGSIPLIEQIASKMIACLNQGGTIFWMGNGGSASDSQHLAAELVGRYTRERKGFPSIALTTDTSILTAVSNDYGYDKVFSRQVEALVKPHDMVFGLSTSGNSPNVIAGLEAAKQNGAVTVGMTGRGGGRMVSKTDYCLRVSSDTTSRIQEAHILIGHILCDCVEMEMTKNK